MIIAATGPRPDKLGGYAPGSYCGGMAHDAYWKLARMVMLYLLEQPACVVITGMAQGFDTAVACACFNVQIRFLAAVPFEGQEKLWPRESQIGYEGLLRRALDVHVVSPGGPAKWKYQKRNEWAVNECTKVMALWDGSTGGGTANTVAYAKKVGKPIDNLWDRWVALQAGGAR